MNDKSKPSSEEERETWLEDDGIGTGLFGGDTYNQMQDGKKGRELDEYIEDVKAGARVAIDQSISILTPWFFSNMPQFYYQTTPREEKVRDLHAVITGHIFESKQTLQLWNRERSKTTFLAPGNDEHIFQSIADTILDLDVKQGAMFTSNDRLLLISNFFTSAYRQVDQNNEKNKHKIKEARALLTAYDLELVNEFLENLDHDMVIHATPPRLVRLFKLYNLAYDREDAMTHLVSKYFHEYARLDIAFKKMPISQTISSLLHLFERYSFQVNRSVMATVNNHTGTPISILTFIFRHESGVTIDEKFVPFLKLNKAAKSLRWVESDHFDELWKAGRATDQRYSLNEINLVRSMGVWNQIFLSKLNPYYYSEERIRKTFVRNNDLLKDLIELFKLRFNPQIPPAKREGVAQYIMNLRARIDEILDRVSRDIFLESLNFLSNILRTNYFYSRKTGLSFRMDPKCLNPDYYPNQPFGFFFLVGRGYRGFHVRYRDTARGGLRIVMPRDLSAYEVAFAGLFDEVIGLAFAQQMKNKDIPEGGAKAVLVLNPGADRETSAIGAIDSILNLITVNPETGCLDTSIIDYYNEQEYIYLGPDENCSNALIDAFVRQARRQGYRYADAFMSSKPEAGINHKQFGVTSEGVNVFLGNMLTELGIDPSKQKFTVKMTGGPDGDVAGNELKILRREYGENARVRAIGDGFGGAYDPNGLDWDELSRLVDQGLSIDHFDKSKLSHESAFVVSADSKENIRVRDSLYATVHADVLIPAGGRPYTVNSDNWKGFLHSGDKLSMRAIVEGANIFFTGEAREALQKRGVLIFKDSSANKCGVICSSFEIISSLILDPQEFMAIKDVYVEQVLEKLREKADLEAKILLREYHERGHQINLVDLSKVLSNVINRVTDLVDVSLAQFSEDQFRKPLNDHIILSYVPAILRKKYHNRILESIPRNYRQAIISADTAARLVYTEGIAFFETLADDDVVATVNIYLAQEQRVLELVKTVTASNLANKDDINYILSHAGTRTLTQRIKNGL